MLDKLFKRLDFKDRTFGRKGENSISLPNKEATKTSLKLNIDNMINEEFNKIVLYTQESYIKLSESISKEIDEDFNNMEIFEMEIYCQELTKALEQDIKNITKNIVEQLPKINKKEIDIHKIK